MLNSSLVRQGTCFVSVTIEPLQLGIVLEFRCELPDRADCLCELPNNIAFTARNPVLSMYSEANVFQQCSKFFKRTEICIIIGQPYCLQRTISQLALGSISPVFGAEYAIN